jgi:hypothetical protein
MFKSKTEFNSFRASLQRWDTQLSPDEVQELLTKIIFLCEEIIDADEPGIDALADPKGYVRDLIAGKIELEVCR